MRDDNKIQIPHDQHAERSLLATLCAPGAGSVAVQILKRITANLFFHTAHKAMFEAARSLAEDKTEINSLTLRDGLEKAGSLHKVGGFTGIVEILAGEDVERPEVLVDILQEKQRRRALIHLGARLTRMAGAHDADSLSVITEIMNEMGLVSRGGHRAEVTPWTNILGMVEDGRAFRDGDGLAGGYWGIPELDEHAPIPAGEVTFIGARPGVGKTALKYMLMCESANRGRIPLSVQLELPDMAARARVASYLTQTSTRKFKEGTYTNFDIAALKRQKSLLERGGTLIPKSGATWPEIEAAILEDRDRRGTNLVVVDYFQIIGRGPVGRGSNEAYQFAKVSDQIRCFARDHQDMGVVLLGQLKTDAANGEPKDGCVADCDQAARDAAVTLMLWRDHAGDTWSVLHKNRDGVLGWKKKLQFDGMGQRFSLPVNKTNQPTDAKPTRRLGQ